MSRKGGRALPADDYYPVRGVGTLWDTGWPPSAEARGALVGRTRAQLLAALEAPQTTTASPGSSR